MHLAAKLAAKNALHKRCGCNLWRWLGLDVLQHCFVHGIQHTAQVLMSILLPAQSEPATSNSSMRQNRMPTCGQQRSGHTQCYRTMASVAEG